MEGSVLMAAIGGGAVALLLVARAPVILRRLLTPQFDSFTRR